MIGQSPLQRAADQPPCDSAAESLCINGCFAVPDRMEHFDLGPHLWFPEHQTIWQSMCRVVEGPPDGFWWRTFRDLKKTRSATECWRLMHLLTWAPFMMLDDSDNGRLLFMLSFAKLERCTQARGEVSVKQGEVAALWRIPDTPYSLEEKRRMLRTTNRPALRMVASAPARVSVDDLDV